MTLTVNQFIRIARIIGTGQIENVINQSVWPKMADVAELAEDMAIGIEPESGRDHDHFRLMAIAEWAKGFENAALCMLPAKEIETGSELDALAVAAGYQSIRQFANDCGYWDQPVSAVRQFLALQDVQS